MSGYAVLTEEGRYCLSKESPDYFKLALPGYTDEVKLITLITKVTELCREQKVLYSLETVSLVPLSVFQLTTRKGEDMIFCQQATSPMELFIQFLFQQGRSSS